MICDKSGRVIAPEQPKPDDHPVRLRRVCAWCQAVLDQGTPGAQTTHGICASCEDGWQRAGDQHWTRRRKAAGLPAAGKLNAPRWCVVYKDGDAWRRTDPVYGKTHAHEQQHELTRARFPGHGRELRPEPANRPA